MLRSLEVSRLDAAQLAIWDQVEAGDLKAITVFLQISNQRCKLLGLYGTTSTEGIKELNALSVLVHLRWLPEDLLSAIAANISECSQAIKDLVSFRVKEGIL